MTPIETLVGDRCRKPGCGALQLTGRPCTDWDCPQRIVTVEDFDAIKSVLTEEFRVSADRATALADARAELERVASAIGSVRFMDPPDGGDVSLSKQVSRMLARGMG